MNELKKIKNNTENSIMINGIFLAPQTETILTNEVVMSIDKTYFISGILIDLGLYNVQEPSINIVTSELGNKNSTSQKQEEKPKRRRRKKLEQEINNEPKIVEESIKVESLKDETIQQEQLKTEVVNTLSSNAITEDELFDYLVGYYKKPPTGIPINDLDDDVHSLIERAKRAVLKNEISFDDLSEELKNIIISSDPTDTNGDGNNDVSLGSGGTADIIGSQILIPIKENMLDEELKNILNEAKIAYQKPLDGIPLNDLSEDVQQKLDIVDTNNHFWMEPVDSFGMLPTLENINKNGDMRLVMDTNIIYRWDADQLTWENISSTTNNNTIDVPTNNVLNTSAILGEFFSYKNQTTFKLSIPYNPGTNQLMVMLNGLLVYKEIDYTEVNDRVVQFKYPLNEDDYVVFSLPSSNVESVVIAQLVEIDARVREIKLQHAFMPGSDALRVFLNGIQLIEGTDNDYIELDSRTLEFNIDLLPGDMLAFRIETTTIAKNIVNQMALLRTIYSDLAGKIDRIQKSIK